MKANKNKSNPYAGRTIFVRQEKESQKPMTVFVQIVPLKQKPMPVTIQIIEAPPKICSNRRRRIGK